MQCSPDGRYTSNMERDDLTRLRHALTQTWNFAPAPSQNLTETELIDLLQRKVEFLLKHDYQRLLSGLYILDIAETKMAEANALESAGETARLLAEAILEREIEKMESRKKYRREGSLDVPFDVNTNDLAGPDDPSG